jgi:hypothetical protein
MPTEVIMIHFHKNNIIIIKKKDDEYTRESQSSTTQHLPTNIVTLCIFQRG